MAGPRYQEFAQTDFGIERVKNWARTSGRLHNNDILISGDVDEILYPATINLLRWCEVSFDQISTNPNELLDVRPCHVCWSLDASWQPGQGLSICLSSWAKYTPTSSHMAVTNNLQGNYNWATRWEEELCFLGCGLQVILITQTKSLIFLPPGTYWEGSTCPGTPSFPRQY